MKKILMPTDFSTNSINALKYAVSLFKDEECTFYLLNTFTPVLYDTEYILYSTTQPGLEEIYRENSVKGLQKVKKRITSKDKNPKHHFELISAFNLLIEEIKEQVKEKNIDLVVMGTQGATGAQEVLMGTNTVQAIKKVKCPILAIPSEYEYTNPDNILFPTDYELDYSSQQLQLLKDIIKNYDSRLNILHVLTKEELSPEKEQNKKKLATQMDSVKHQFYSKEKQALTEAIYDFQNEHPTDMLVMINNKHSFFENLLFRPVINKIGFHIKVPFLVIPSGKYSS
ncbi:MAG: universal stress protein [Salegentibacter sp.]|uniref:universal stress protein n=1 Tax=Salegentibacter sp. TaxID=1903072 RepID=UPI002870B10D|nr:universal stress protein [Salegentibacter sp.]MDR9457434.1 universal stress protein [Salegentibacter sp.]